MNALRPRSEDPLEDVEFEWPRQRNGEDSVYSPLRDCTELYIYFADLRPDPAELKRFTDEFGDLTLRGLTEYEFIEQLLQVKLVLAFCDALDSRNTAQLKPFLNVTPGLVQVRASLLPDGNTVPGCAKGAVMEFTPSIAHSAKRRNILAAAKKDVFTPSRAMVADLVNAGLRDVLPALVLTRSGELEPRLRPKSLISAIWYQVYELAVGRKVLRRCEICGKRMDVTDRHANKRVHDRCSKRERMRRLRAKEKSE
jgi:hypothetical protein